MERVLPWLEPFTWEVVTAQNAVLCQAKRSLNLPADQAVVVRSLAGHIVAGVASEEEKAAFREFCERLR